MQHIKSLAQPVWHLNQVSKRDRYKSGGKKCSTNMPLQPGRWHNGSRFFFCVDGCPFNPEPISTCAEARREVTGYHAGDQEVGRCSTRGGSLRMYNTFASTKANKAEPTLALKPREDVTRNPSQGYQWPQNWTCVYVSAKNI